MDVLSFFNFQDFKNNGFIFNNTHSLFQKIKNLSLSLLFVYFIIFLCVIFIIFPLDILITNVFHLESIRGLIKQGQEKIVSYPFYLVVFLGPFAEELLFRLALRLGKFNVAVFCGVFIYFIFGGSITKFDIYNIYYLYIILISLIVSVVSYFYLSIKNVIFLEQKKCWLIIFSVLIFGLIHIYNIKILHWQLILFYPFFVLPQMIMGYFITILRLKYGFFWGLLLHILINAFSFLLK
jgi:hypothetical protein